MPPTRSGARSVRNPKTRPQRLLRLVELTQSIEVHQGKVESLSGEREAIIIDLREHPDRSEQATFEAIGNAMGKTFQAAHKLYTRAKARQNGAGR